MSEYLHRRGRIDISPSRTAEARVASDAAVEIQCEGNGIALKGLGVLLDNTAALDIVRTGRNLTIRQIAKTQGVSTTWLNGLYNDPEIHFGYITSGMMAADIFTKVFTNRTLWESLCR